MALDITKTDSVLGVEVWNHLYSLGVENVSNLTTYTDENKINVIARCQRDIMTVLGLNLNDDSLKETPMRVGQTFVNELFWGLDYKNFPKCTTVDNTMKYDEMVVEKNITVKSVCEHHFLAIDGYATVAYIPKNKILGLSKFSRIVEFFSRRPQIQERLTAQIFHALQFVLETENIAVSIHATHQCLKFRGAEDTNNSTVTSKLGGLFKTDSKARLEFIAYLPKSQ